MLTEKEYHQIRIAIKNMNSILKRKRKLVDAENVIELLYQFSDIKAPQLMYDPIKGEIKEQ